MVIQFFDKIKFKTVKVKSARDVVLYSFIVQNSLTCLDLSTCECSLRLQSISKQEQCRMRLKPRRQILYTLNLDLPINVESSLKAVTSNADDQKEHDAFHLGALLVSDILYSRNLLHVDYVIEKIKMIKFVSDKRDKLVRYLNVMELLKFNPSTSNALLLFNHFVYLLYHGCSDSNIVVKFAKTFKFTSWIFENEHPKLVHFFLDHAFHIRHNFWQEAEPLLDPINGCIFFRRPGNIIELLQYRNVVLSSPKLYLENINAPLDWIKRIAEKNKNIPDNRAFLMIQLLHFYRFNRSWESLLYIWRSIPDPLLRVCEIISFFENFISPIELRGMIFKYKFHFVEEIDKFPRPLKHLCRVAVRSALIRNHQLSYGIEKLGMPDSIEDYLNLKCCLHADKLLVL